MFCQVLAELPKLLMLHCDLRAAVVRDMAICKQILQRTDKAAVVSIRAALLEFVDKNQLWQ